MAKHDDQIIVGSGPSGASLAPQAGACRFGVDRATSLPNLDFRADGVGALCITDARFFPSISAVNPTVAIIANALRGVDILKDRL